MITPKTTYRVIRPSNRRTWHVSRPEGGTVCGKAIAKPIAAVADDSDEIDCQKCYDAVQKAGQ